jgi:hypothetical protein
MKTSCWWTACDSSSSSVSESDQGSFRRGPKWARVTTTGATTRHERSTRRNLSQQPFTSRGSPSKHGRLACSSIGSSHCSERTRLPRSTRRCCWQRWRSWKGAASSLMRWCPCSAFPWILTLLSRTETATPGLRRAGISSWGTKTSSSRCAPNGRTLSRSSTG